MWLDRDAYCRICAQGLKRKGFLTAPLENEVLYGCQQEVSSYLFAKWERLLVKADQVHPKCAVCSASMVWEGETIVLGERILPCMEINNRVYFRTPLGAPGIALRNDGGVDWREVANDVNRRANEAGLPGRASPVSSLGSLGEDILEQFGDDSGMDEGEV